MRFVILVAATTLGSSSILNAQITVQQPVVRSTSVGTTVSVPDRGSVFLGGVTSAEASRQSYGPLRTGTSRGYSLSASSVSASVRIIDLQAMDEAILNSVPDSPTAGFRSPRMEVHTPTVRPEVVAIDKAARFERMAQQAEAEGRTGVAKLHWQMAARHGSTLARERSLAAQSR
ncbi:MAG: hypothetical protein WCJ09_21365 [Planctomycetota bacterium]